MSSNPWLKSVTLGTAGTKLSLFSLIQALDPTYKYPQCSKLSIQLDPGAGAAKLLIGNEDISTVNYGVSLQAGQALLFEGIEQNLYELNQVYLQSDTDSVRANIVVVVH